MAEVTNTLGRRKTAVARLYMTPGKGEYSINGRTLSDYFPSEILRIIVNQPFALTKTEGTYDVKVNMGGGGIKGQAEALRVPCRRLTKSVVQL
jgi:small subunit ribosomal protein S9